MCCVLRPGVEIGALHCHLAWRTLHHCLAGHYGRLLAGKLPAVTWHKSTSVMVISTIIADVFPVPPSFRLGSPPLTQPTPPEDSHSPFRRPILASSSSSTHKTAHEYLPALENCLISLVVSDSQ
ncbi:hypothetical protein H9L39_09072 [Fusarium oxysporum f. sp. albedinis]|nr:hypothetical protein H9L39_09072 [Fusarium oxysporum f. sp. albedinis]